MDLRIDAQLVGTEFVTGLYLNSIVNPTLLNFGDPTGGSGGFEDPSISLASNTFRPDGDGFFDILLEFENAPPGARFDNSDFITYHITLTSGLLSEGNFNAFSAPGPGPGNPGPFQAAAHIQGIGPEGEGSGFIAPNGVPDGGMTMMLLGSALACLGALRRRFA